MHIMFIFGECIFPFGLLINFERVIACFQQLNILSYFYFHISHNDFFKMCSKNSVAYNLSFWHEFNEKKESYNATLRPICVSKHKYDIEMFASHAWFHKNQSQMPTVENIPCQIHAYKILQMHMSFVWKERLIYSLASLNFKYVLFPHFSVHS